jgi:hypothetical protein
VSPTIDNPQEITTIHFAGVIRQTPATRERVKLARNILIRRHSSMVPRCSESLDEIKSIILAASSWKKDNYLAAVEAMKERPRKRKLQTLPLKIQNLINVFG